MNVKGVFEYFRLNKCNSVYRILHCELMKIFVLLTLLLYYTIIKHFPSIAVLTFMPTLQGLVAKTVRHYFRKKNSRNRAKKCITIIAYKFI